MTRRIWLLPPVAGVAIAASAMLGAAAPPAASGDAARGASVYAANCGSCHALDANRVGPAHRGVFGRRAGVASGYAYSPAMKKAQLVWNAVTLDRWLQNPRQVIPGTRMAFRLGDAGQRADVIAYLRASSVKSR
jgi:cytochrome c